ncbi:Hypp9109 [Branchiostoma lanceolatum]|uniref:Hypp9109 protein n=1 Tax=Branchiostoma lanceolatum TaxID=7740 RepID=A0A8K0EFY7_BRALA|nr:Hypp9109 [Branchiostoma lanceolatum]
MVDLSGSGPDAPLEHAFDNRLFIIPAAIIMLIIGLAGYKLYSSVSSRERAREEKRQRRKERKDVKTTDKKKK